MSWTSPRTWSASEVVTATIMNTHVRDNLSETAPAKVSAKGDLVAATAANAIARVPLGSASTVLRSNTGCSMGVDYSEVNGLPLNVVYQASGSSAADLPSLRLRRSRGSISTTCLVSNGDSVGAITFDAWDTNRFLTPAQIICEIDGTAASADMPGRLRFLTTADGASTLSERMRIDNAGGVYIGDTANANITVGLTINQGAGVTAQAFAIKSDDITHGMTTETETDTYFAVLGDDSTTTAPRLAGWGEASVGIAMRGAVVNETSTRSTAADAAVVLKGVVKSGTTTANLSANMNLVAIKNGNSTTRFIFDSDGDYHADASNNASAFDWADDAQLVRVLEIERAPDSVIRTQFDNWLQYNRRDLERMKIATFNDCPGGDGSIFVNYTGLARLHSGAIWQQYTRTCALEERVDEMAASLARLKFLMSGSPL